MVDKVLEFVKDRLGNTYRFRHTIAVAEEAKSIASIMGVDVDRTYIAALMHDTARPLSSEDMLSEAKKYKINISTLDKKRPILLHGQIAANWLIDKLGIFDWEIYESICLHTTGAVNMGKMAATLFMADKIAITEGSHIDDSVLNVRKLLPAEIEKVFLWCFTYSFKYLMDNYQELHPVSIEAWNYYCKKENLEVLFGKR
ncbi:nicotinate-nucleotide adenylyltransferase [Thermodesulfobium acidiphilum]|uniref:bis(5'-nucleosyl)-tetraphosphatase (symmetrical) n=1 Tax=Thermodesulfobium acidiphilum TaxID=1794699 RepID=A0A2R4W1H6_THEAF|nr:bis(5'-nucleosyl)-tetraphosphatase (symmetrical) YqeK [Thermodesulfobium acidiphilum]AWB10635.1 nicotinate-nucleotide adenylyltransferase [Thermodesulfobium acidiphilum]